MRKFLALLALPAVLLMTSCKDKEVTVNGEKVGNNLPILNAEILPTSVILYTGDNKNPKNVAYIDDLSSDLF